MRIEDRSRPANSRLDRPRVPARLRDAPPRDFAALLRGKSPLEPEPPRVGSTELASSVSEHSIGAAAHNNFVVEDELVGRHEDGPAEDPTFQVAANYSSFETRAMTEVRAPTALAPHDPITQPLVQAIAVAVDAHQRKLVFLRVSLPGRGGVDVRIRRGVNGIEVLLSTEDDDLRRELQTRRGDLAARGRAANLGLSRIDVVAGGH